MSWLEWLFVSIGLYVAAGLIVALGAAYVYGWLDAKKDNPEGYGLRTEEIAPTVFLWPLYLLAMSIAEWIPNVFQLAYKRGKTRSQRKIERHGRKAQDQAFKDLCKQHGWNYRKLRRTREAAELS